MAYSDDILQDHHEHSQQSNLNLSKQSNAHTISSKSTDETNADLGQENTLSDDSASDFNLQSVQTKDEVISLLADKPISLPSNAITPLLILTYLRSIKEFELYYYLFNQVGVANITDNKLEISREGADKGLNNRLAEILFTWTGSKWSVIIIDTVEQLSLKDKMKAKFMESDEWKMLQDYSNNITLTDIILD